MENNSAVDALTLNDTSFDYYDGLFSGWKFALATIGWLISQAFGNFFLLMVVDIEPDLQYRTIINGICTSITKLTLVSNVIVVNIDFLRMIFGPLDRYTCMAQVILNDHNDFEIELLLAETIIFRVMYLAFWESLAAIREDFLEAFLYTFNFAMCFFLQTIMFMSNDIYKTLKVLQ